MVSSDPPILPISNPQTTTTTSSAAESQPPVATPAFRSFINNLTAQGSAALSQRRPWSELADRAAFSRPDSLSDAAARVRRNYSYFRVNYLSLLAAVIAFSLLWNPGSLILLLGLLCAWTFLYLLRPSDQPLVLLGRSFSHGETLGVLVLLSVLVIFLTSVGSVLISSLLVGVSLVCAHAAFRAPEDLFLEEQEEDQASAGFLSFAGIGSAAKNVAASSHV